MADAAKSAILNNFCKLKFYQKKKDWKLAPEKEAEELEKEMVKVKENMVLQTSSSHNSLVALEEDQNTDLDVQEIISDDEDDDMKSWCEKRGCCHELKPVLLLSPQPQCHAVQPPPPQQQSYEIRFPAPQQQVLEVQPPAPQQQSATNSGIRLPETYVRAIRRLKHCLQEIVAVGNYEEFARGASVRRHSSEYDLTVLVSIYRETI